MDHQSRRAAIIAQIRETTGIDESMIVELVDAFYDKVRDDPLLGPIFDARIDDWDFHLQRMYAFWSSVALMSGVYNGQPMAKHMPMPVDARHFDRWLALFEETATELCPPVAAEHFIERARRIAQSLEIGVASGAGVMLGRGERLVRTDIDLPATVDSDA